MFSPEQNSVVEAPLAPLSVVACAGSGKTRTAVRRLVELRRHLGASRGHVALLSFSNVAVNTFRRDYAALSLSVNDHGSRMRVTIETADGFLTNHVLRPHGHRTMRTQRTPFLVSGSEAFLKNAQFQFWIRAKDGKRFPAPIDRVGVELIDEAPRFFASSSRSGAAPSMVENGATVAHQLAAIGAYTHDLGRYWSYRTLKEQPLVLRALARRYPYILIDEAQDVGALHQAILELLMSEGACVSLIGDPRQAIYGFVGSDGSFLSNYTTSRRALAFSLTTNYRSIPAILRVANAITGGRDQAHREATSSRHGAFVVTYAEDEESTLIDDFCRATATAKLDLSRSAVVCRARELCHRLRGIDATYGRGVVHGFVVATVLRDKEADYARAFQHTIESICGLLSNVPEGLPAQLKFAGQSADLRLLRRELWTFVRSPDTGLPPASMIAASEWHPLLVRRVKALLQVLRVKFGFQELPNLGSRLAKAELPDTPLLSSGIVDEQRKRVRIDTVHQVKGETLDAVLYIVTKSHLKALVSGTSTEEGRIGYVALTRARDLFWLGVRDKDLKEFQKQLTSFGFNEWTA